MPATNFIKVKLLDEHAKIPSRSHEEDAGLDLYLPEAFSLEAGENKLIMTKVSLEIPKGYFGMICPRSSMNKKTVITKQGIVDSGYRGDIGIVLYNHGKDVLYFGRHDRIAQLVIMPCAALHDSSLRFCYGEAFRIIQVEELDETERGDGGFGSTGA